jgi:tRNA(Ile)-lysidine synthase
MARIVPPGAVAAHDLLRAVRNSLAQLPDGLVVVACSGGPDSLALAAATAEVCAASGRPSGALVVDHQLQAGSAHVAKTAAHECRELGLSPVEVLTVTVASGAGPEASARVARYEAMDAMAAELGAVAVLLGHTRDDQAETVLLGLARGSGPRSLAGMPASRGHYLRPLLGVRRQTIRTACDHWELTPWDDPHNSDPTFTRVRVRDEVLPVLESQLGPGIAESLVRTADLARADCDALDEWASRELSGHVTGPQVEPVTASSLDCRHLLALPQAVRTRVIRMWLLSQGAPQQRLAAEHIWQVDRVVSQWRGQGPVSLPGRICVRRECDRLWVAADDSREWS